MQPPYRLRQVSTRTRLRESRTAYRRSSPNPNRRRDMRLRRAATSRRADAPTDEANPHHRRPAYFAGAPRGPTSRPRRIPGNSATISLISCPRLPSSRIASFLKFKLAGASVRRWSSAIGAKHNVANRRIADGADRDRERRNGGTQSLGRRVLAKACLYISTANFASPASSLIERSSTDSFRWPQNGVTASRSSYMSCVDADRMGSSDQKALSLEAADRLQELELFFGFHALGEHWQA